MEAEPECDENKNGDQEEAAQDGGGDLGWCGRFGGGCWVWWCGGAGWGDLRGDHREGGYGYG